MSIPKPHSRAFLRTRFAKSSQTVLSRMFDAGDFKGAVVTLRQALYACEGNQTRAARRLDMGIDALRDWILLLDLKDEVKEIVKASKRKFRLF